MQKILLSRVASLPIMLIGISLLVFAIGRQVPGDPAVLYAGGERADPVVVEQIRSEYGLDRPVAVQYARYLERLGHGDLGYSFTERAPVRQVLADRFPATIELTGAALILGAPTGIFLGIAAARRKGSSVDHATTLIAICGVSIPLFWAGLMLGWLFSVKLGWLPLGGRLPAFSDFEPITGIYSLDALLRADFGALGQILRHLALPAMTLAIIPAAVLARFTRASFVEVFEQDYTRTARGVRFAAAYSGVAARGEERSVTPRHSVRTHHSGADGGSGTDRIGVLVARRWHAALPCAEHSRLRRHPGCDVDRRSLLRDLQSPRRPLVLVSRPADARR